MTGDEAVAEIQLALGFRGDRADVILDQLQKAQRRFEQQGVIYTNGSGVISTYWPWFLLEEMAELITIVNEERVPFPDDFLQEWEEGQLWRFDPAATVPEEEWILLEKGDLDVLRANLSGEGAPRAYAVDGKYYRVLPVPDAGYTLKQIYYASDALVSGGTENKWLKYTSDLLIGDAGMRMALGMRDKDAYGDFQVRRDRAAQALYMTHEERQHVNRRYVMGGED